MAARKRLLWPYVCVAGVGIAHRALLWILYRDNLADLVVAIPRWRTPQLLPAEMVRASTGTALLYLQQTPPIPNLLFALATKYLEQPESLANGLVLLQGVISVATALLLVHTVLMLFPARTVVAAVIGGVFVLSTDLVVLEYNSFGQTFYENLSMLLVLATVALLIAYRDRGRPLTACGVGLTVALLALTRASWSYFAVPALLLVAFFGSVYRARGIALFIVPVVLLHGGWALKNWAIFGTLSPATSTWTGWNLASGIVNVGLRSRFSDFVATHTARDGTPLHCWVVETPIGWVPYLPVPPTDIDQTIALRTGLTQPLWNTDAFHLESDRCSAAVLAFCAESPDACAMKLRRSYLAFWQPIAHYGRLYVSLFAVRNRIANSFDVPQIAHLYLSGELPEEQYLVSGGVFHKQFTIVPLYTPRWIEPLILVANILAVHIIAPLLLLWWCVRPPSGELGRRRRDALLIALTVYGYLAIVSVVATYGENMRFRLDAEPVIWLITIVSCCEAWRILVRRN